MRAAAKVVPMRMGWGIQDTRSEARTRNEATSPKDARAVRSRPGRARKGPKSPVRRTGRRAGLIRKNYRIDVSTYEINNKQWDGSEGHRCLQGSWGGWGAG